MYKGRSIHLSCKLDGLVYIKAKDSDSELKWPCMGIEVKREKMEMSFFYQSLMEFILTADWSLVPFMHVSRNSNTVIQCVM